MDDRLEESSIDRLSVMYSLSDIRDEAMGSRGQSTERSNATTRYTNPRQAVQCQHCGHQHPWLGVGCTVGDLTSDSGGPSRCGDCGAHGASPPLSPFQRSPSPDACLRDAGNELPSQWWWLEDSSEFEEARKTKSMHDLQRRCEEDSYIDFPAKVEVARQKEGQMEEIKRKAPRGFSISSLIAPTKKLKRNVGSISESVKDFVCRKDSAMPGKVGYGATEEVNWSTQHHMDSYSDLAPLRRQERRVLPLQSPPCYSASDSDESVSSCASIGIATPVRISICSRGAASASYISKTSIYSGVCSTGSCQVPRKQVSAMQLRPHVLPPVALNNPSIAHVLQKQCRKDHMEALAVAVKKAHVNGSFSEEARETRFMTIATGQDEHKTSSRGIARSSRPGGEGDKAKWRDFRDTFTHLAGLGNSVSKEAKRRGGFFTRGDADAAGFTEGKSRGIQSRNSNFLSGVDDLSPIDFLGVAIQQTGLGLSM